MRGSTATKRPPTLWDKGWSPTKMCPECGRFVVLLKIPEAQQDAYGKKWVLCEYRAWDGSQFYISDRNGANARRHPRVCYAKHAPKKPFVPRETDEFFSLIEQPESPGPP